MDRPDILHVGGTLYWTIRVVDNADQPVAPTSVAVTARINNGDASSDGVLITPVGTGVYDVSYTASLLEGQTVTITETVVRNSKTFISGWQATVVAREDGASSPSAAVPGSMTEAANTPTSVSADGTSVTMPGVMDRIEAANYDAANTAASKGHRGIRFSRFVPGSAVGPRSNQY